MAQLSVQNRTQLQALPGRVFPVLLIIISKAWASTYHHKYTGLKAGPNQWYDQVIICKHIPPKKLSKVSKGLFILPHSLERSKKLNQCKVSKSVVICSWRQHKNNWVQVVRIISDQIWSSLIFWSWLSTCRRSAFTAASLQCCTTLNAAWCGIFHLSLELFSSP